MCQCPPPTRAPCRRRRSSSLNWPGTLLVARGSRCGVRGSSTGGSRVRDTPCGAPQRDSPPAQGAMQVLGVVAVPQILVDKRWLTSLRSCSTCFSSLCRSTVRCRSPSSPTECWTLQVRNRDRHALCQGVQKAGDSSAVLGTVIDAPLDVQRLVQFSGSVLHTWPLRLCPRSSLTSAVAWSWLGLLLMLQFAQFSLLLSSGPRCSASWSATNPLCTVSF